MLHNEGVGCLAREAQQQAQRERAKAGNAEVREVAWEVHGLLYRRPGGRGKSKGGVRRMVEARRGFWRRESPSTAYLCLSTMALQPRADPLGLNVHGPSPSLRIH